MSSHVVVECVDRATQFCSSVVARVAIRPAFGQKVQFSSPLALSSGRRPIVQLLTTAIFIQQKLKFTYFLQYVPDCSSWLEMLSNAHVKFG